MAQNTILAAGTTAATSTDVTLAAGATAAIGIFASSGTIPDGVACAIYIDSPGADVMFDRLDANKPVVTVPGPGTYRVTRPAVSSAIGVWSET